MFFSQRPRQDEDSAQTELAFVLQKERDNNLRIWLAELQGDLMGTRAEHHDGIFPRCVRSTSRSLNVS